MSPIYFRTIDKNINTIRLMEEENSALQQQLKEQEEKKKKKKEMIRKLNDDLRTLQTDKERLLTRYVHRTWRSGVP